MGATAGYGAIAHILGGCSLTAKHPIAPTNYANGVPYLKPQLADELQLLPGLDWKPLVSWGDTLNKKGELFGYNNDFIALKNLGPNQLGMWVNHESVTPFYMNGWRRGMARTQTQVEQERDAVGGSYFLIQRDSPRSAWQLSHETENNFRLSAKTSIPFSQNMKILGSTSALGTLGNCAGGQTPWGTILTCEENYEDYFGEATLENGARLVDRKPAVFGWHQFHDVPPEHYGWVVEVDPKNQKSKKHVALGRFAHECATVRKTHDGRVVVYMGDDTADQCLYKFIARDKNSVEFGELFVADTKNGRWISLDRQKQPVLQKHFRSQLEVQLYTRQAAHLVGGTPLDRPEDVEIQPGTGHVYVSLTNNKDRKNAYGSLLRVIEKNNDPLSLEFSASTFISGGPEAGFACPDNLVFDLAGNLWMTSDISEIDIDKGPYRGLGNNGLFYIPLSGPAAGQAIRVASAPRDAELTGPCFSPDGSTVFLSVQHPGQMAQKLESGGPTSHWPLGAPHNPKPSVVQISGPLLQNLIEQRFPTGA
jgi:secreted PhoX family phosphatase